MRVSSLLNLLHAPTDRAIIKRWTVNSGKSPTHELSFPDLQVGDSFSFLALGDTGNSDAFGPGTSPQEGVAAHLIAESVLTEGGVGELVLHTGDVVYVAGEQRLYERNFRSPYAGCLTDSSTASSLTFRIPFLCVPGNHDYYDIGGWSTWVARLPILGRGLRALSHRLFALSFPEGGSDQGAVYMRQFVDETADTTNAPISYIPGVQTRLPNRYYRFRVGNVDFFALDSNTLDAPVPSADSAQVKLDAEKRIRKLQRAAQKVQEEVEHTERELAEVWEGLVRIASADPDHCAQVVLSAEAVGKAASTVKALQARVSQDSRDFEPPDQLTQAIDKWQPAIASLEAAEDIDERAAAIDRLEEASSEICLNISELDRAIGALAESDERVALTVSREALERSLEEFSASIGETPDEICAHLRTLTEQALDAQRQLALARRQADYSPEDYDAEQIDWLRSSLESSASENPNGWRVVFMHHPLYTTIVNHAELADIHGVRSNLLEIIARYAHLVLAGHSHAFEWIRSSAAPNTGLFVTGGGGQVTLRRSLLDSRLLSRNRSKYLSLVEAGVEECAAAGVGPAGADGSDGRLYHFLRINVTTDVLTVRPIGVRQTESGYRSEVPMPVFHYDNLGRARTTRTRLLEGVEVRRGQPVRPVWG